MRQPVRRKNIRRTIAALRNGDPTRAPLVSSRWPGYVRGMIKAEKRGTKIAADLVRRKGPAEKMPQDRVCRVPKSPAPPPLPARTDQRPSGKRDRRERIKAKRARANNPSLANLLFDFGTAELLAATGPGSISTVGAGR
jgi:hypothetical protein